MAQSRYVLILAKNAKQAKQYADRTDLPRFGYRAVASASSIRGIKSADVHILPDFLKRVDRHAIFAALRYRRGIEYFDVEMPPAPVEDLGDGMGEQLTIADVLHLTPAEADIALDTNKLPEPEPEDNAEKQAALDEMFPDPERAEILEPAPATKPRRKRCKVCGRLTAAAYDVEPEGHDEAAHGPKVVESRDSLWDE